MIRIDCGVSRFVSKGLCKIIEIRPLIDLMFSFGLPNKNRAAVMKSCSDIIASTIAGVSFSARVPLRFVETDVLASARIYTYNTALLISTPQEVALPTTCGVSYRPKSEKLPKDERALRENCCKTIAAKATADMVTF